MTTQQHRNQRPILVRFCALVVELLAVWVASMVLTIAVVIGFLALGINVFLSIDHAYLLVGECCGWPVFGVLVQELILWAFFAPSTLAVVFWWWIVRPWRLRRVLDRIQGDALERV